LLDSRTKNELEEYLSTELKRRHKNMQERYGSMPPKIVPYITNWDIPVTQVKTTMMTGYSIK
jgi:hypothetical protein